MQNIEMDTFPNAVFSNNVLVNLDWGWNSRGNRQANACNAYH